LRAIAAIAAAGLAALWQVLQALLRIDGVTLD
jgi:hypothetical protein